jgi:hypothetical protein
MRKVVTKPKPTLRRVAIVACLGCAGVTTIPLNGLAFEGGTVYLVSHPSPEGEAQSSNVLVFDNNLLDRLFGKHRATEKTLNGSGHANNPPHNLSEEAASSPILPNGWLLAGITRTFRRGARLLSASRKKVEFCCRAASIEKRYILWKKLLVLMPIQSYIFTLAVPTIT